MRSTDLLRKAIIRYNNNKLANKRTSFTSFASALARAKQGGRESCIASSLGKGSINFYKQLLFSLLVWHAHDARMSSWKKDQTLSEQPLCWGRKFQISNTMWIKRIFVDSCPSKEGFFWVQLSFRMKIFSFDRSKKLDFFPPSYFFLSVSFSLCLSLSLSSVLLLNVLQKGVRKSFSYYPSLSFSFHKKNERDCAFMYGNLDLHPVHSV